MFYANVGCLQREFRPLDIGTGNTGRLSIGNGMKSTASSLNIQPGWALLFAAWIVAASATSGSLFFSEIMRIPVCALCWYQRIAMYPLAVVLAIGLFPYDRKAVRYAGALVGVGWLTAMFHVLLVAGIIPERVQPCVQGIPCSETYISLLGFLNIPVMSLLTFTLVGVLLFYAHRMEPS